MALALLAALASAVCYGVASTLQGLGARATPHVARVDPRLLVRVLRQGPFVAGIGLDVAGFLAQFWALHRLPLFVVQAAQAGNLAVTAVVAVPVLGARLTGRQWVAVGAVGLGLAMLAFSSGTQSPTPAGWAFQVALLLCVQLVAAAGFAAAGLREPVRSIALGLVAGVGFGVVALAARTLVDLSLAVVVRDPASYALAEGGAIAFLFYVTGLQRGVVTVVTAGVVVAETALPAAVGVLMFGDRTRPGLASAAVVGFTLAVAGALALARFGDPSGAGRADARRH